MSDEQKQDEEVLCADQERKPIKIMIKGEVKEFFLVGMTAKEVGKWKTAQSTRVKYDGQGRPIGAKNLEGVETSLITKCLQDANGTFIPQPMIEEWSSQVIQVLMRMCVQMNALDEESAEAAKKA